jgi:hypothetical protein
VADGLVVVVTDVTTHSTGLVGVAPPGGVTVGLA